MSSQNPRHTVEFRTILESAADAVYQWHWEPGTLEKLIPPWETVEVLRPAPGPIEGATAILCISIGPYKVRWTAKHCDIIPGRQFVDVQQSGPFAYWHHLHKFEPIDADSCELIDRIEYELPLSPLSQPFVGGFVQAKIRRMFRFRHEVTASEIRAQSRTQSRTMQNE